MAFSSFAWAVTLPQWGVGAGCSDIAFRA